MDNSKLTKQFADMYSSEIAALIADLELQDVHISFDGRRPEGLREDPTRMWECHEVESDDHEQWEFAVRFCWNNIIDRQDELRYGVMALAQCLHAISQQVKDVLGTEGMECDCNTCQRLAYEALLQDAHDYAYEAVRRLFNLFSDDEIKTLEDYGCFCKQCRKTALRERPEVPKQRLTLAA